MTEKKSSFEGTRSMRNGILGPDNNKLREKILSLPDGDHKFYFEQLLDRIWNLENRNKKLEDKVDALERKLAELARNINK